MYKYQTPKNKIRLPSRLLVVLCTFLVVCILSTSISLASDDIDPSTYNWLTDPNDGMRGWQLINSSGNAYWVVTLYIHATTNLYDSHCKTDYGTKLEHYHSSGDFTGQYLTDANRYWDWYYSPIGGSSCRIASATNQTNCLCYAMDSYAGGANYDYWVEPGADNKQGNDMFTDDCSMRYPPIYADVEVDDKLGYYYLDEYYRTVVGHATIVNSVSSDEPTEIEWKNGHSGVYRWDCSSADDQYSTPGCDVTKFNVGEPPEGEYYPDYHDGGFGIAFYD